MHVSVHMCAYVVHMSCICVHIYVLCCMYVHMCAHLYVSMRLALFPAKNTCTYAHTYTYSSSYMHINFKYMQKYIPHKAVHIRYVFACICMYMSVSCVYPVQYLYVSEKLCFCSPVQVSTACMCMYQLVST